MPSHGILGPAMEGILGLAFPSLSFGGIEPFFEARASVEEPKASSNEWVKSSGGVSIHIILYVYTYAG